MSKKYISKTLYIVSAAIAIISIIVFLIGFLNGGYKSYSHWNLHLLSPLFPIALSVVLLFVGRCVEGKSKWYSPVVGGLLTFFALVIPANINLRPIEHQNTGYEWAQQWNSIEKVKTNLNGTIWTYTASIGENDMFNMWCRLEFKNDKLYYCEVSPSEGDWGNPQVCDYTIEEKRYSNTGERYVGVFWEGSLMMKYVFVPSERSISYQGRNGYVFGAYLQMKDIFPWH